MIHLGEVSVETPQVLSRGWQAAQTAAADARHRLMASEICFRLKHLVPTYFLLWHSRKKLTPCSHIAGSLRPIIQRAEGRTISAKVR